MRDDIDPRSCSSRRRQRRTAGHTLPTKFITIVLLIADAVFLHTFNMYMFNVLAMSDDIDPAEQTAATWDGRTHPSDLVYHDSLLNSRGSLFT